MCVAGSKAEANSHRNLPCSGRLLPVESVTDLDHNKHGQSHRFGMWIVEYFTIDALKTLVLYKALHVMCLRKSPDIISQLSRETSLSFIPY